MEANLRALFEQEYPDLALCFLVESANDPALGVIRRLQPEYPQVASRTVVTGIARDCGQKVHNLIQGTQALPGDCQIIAFVDSDACPHPQWLSRLVDRLHSGKFAVATGYRWYVPARPTFANRMLSAINNTVIAALGPHGFNLVWGGAWAIRVSAFRELGLPDAWRGTVSDDLVVSRLVHGAKLKVAYEPHCLVASAAQFNWEGVREFLRRQYLMVRVYAPTWWRFGLATAALSQLNLIGLFGLTIAFVVVGGPWKIAAALLGFYYVAMAVRAGMATRAVRPFVGAVNGEYDRVAQINIWAWPLVSLAVGWGLCASAVGRTVVWRGIHYCLESSTRTRILKRPLDGEVALSPLEIIKRAA
jgi:cellulose synthase/poly-beta-1,6-N-acetylglucosamine synthase-like glycosyltransferase